VHRRAAGAGRSAAGLSIQRILDPRSRGFFPDWETVDDDTAAALHVKAGHAPTDRKPFAFIGEPTNRSDALTIRWTKHNVRLHRTATERLRNTVVRHLGLTGNAFQLLGDDLTLIVYTAAVGSHDQEKLDFLTRWAGQPRLRASIEPAAAASFRRLWPRTSARPPSGVSLMVPSRDARTQALVMIDNPSVDLVRGRNWMWPLDSEVPGASREFFGAVERGFCSLIGVWLGRLEPGCPRVGESP
jgi:MmyB-like transcription regulator ligand binding domain